MATTYERTETLQRPAYSIFEMLLGNLQSPPRRGKLHSTWDVAHSDTFLTDQGWRAVQVFGFTSAFEPKTTAGKVQYIPFIVKLVEMDDYVTEVSIVVSYPLGSFHPDDSQTYSASQHLLHDYQRNVQIAEKLLHFCVAPRRGADVVLNDMLKRLENLFRPAGQIEKRKRELD